MDFTGERFVPELCDKEITIEHSQRYLFAKAMVEGKKVLDAACGDGYGSHVLAAYAQEVIGLDIDAESIASAQKKYQADNLTYVQGSIAEIPFGDNTFDVIVSFETYEHVTEELQIAFLKEVRRVLKPNGSLIISTPNKAVYTDLVEGENQFHIKEWTSDEFLAQLRDKFRNVDVYCQYPNVGYFIAPNGQDHMEVIAPESNQNRARYIICVCSDAPIGQKTAVFCEFCDEMYYFLNRRCNIQEREVRQLKAWSDHLERDVAELKARNEYLEKRMTPGNVKAAFIKKLTQFCHLSKNKS